MSPPDPRHPRQLTEQSYEVLTQLRDLVPEMVLIGGWGTWVRDRGLPSHDIDLIVTPSDCKAVLAIAVESSQSDHLGGPKLRAEVDGIHVDLYVPHRSRLGNRLRLRVENLLDFAEHFDGWRVLDVDAHAATKLAALLDRPESLPGEKDRWELFALFPAMDPNGFADRLQAASELDPSELAEAVTQGLDYLRDLEVVGRSERRTLAHFTEAATGRIRSSNPGDEGRQSNGRASTWRRGRAAAPAASPSRKGRSASGDV